MCDVHIMSGCRAFVSLMMKRFPNRSQFRRTSEYNTKQKECPCITHTAENSHERERELDPAMPNLTNGGPTGASLDAGDEADEFDEEEDRPRFCSLDPPISRTGVTTHLEFFETCRRGQVRAQPWK